MRDTSAFCKPNIDEEESLQDKLDKIKNIFNEEEKTPKPADKPAITPRNQPALAVPDQFSVMRPRTNDKAKELEELTKLIQAATGSVGMVVETS